MGAYVLIRDNVGHDTCCDCGSFGAISVKQF